MSLAARPHAHERSDAAQLAGAALVAAVRARPDALTLLTFAASEEHFVLRQRFRVAIA